MTKDRKSPIDDAREQIDIRLGGLLGELGSALSEALQKLDTAGNGEVLRDHVFDSGNGPIRASAGIRIRTLGGTAEASASGRKPEQPVNKHSASPAAAPEEDTAQPRPINATILDGPASWQLIAELPGIDASNVSLTDDGGELKIIAEGRGRRYEGAFATPQGVRVSEMSMSMQNGILEVVHDKAGAKE